MITIKFPMSGDSFTKNDKYGLKAMSAFTPHFMPSPDEFAKRDMVKTLRRNAYSIYRKGGPVFTIRTNENGIFIEKVS